jgi:rSAM/selenodomain-associated transferase 2
MTLLSVIIPLAPHEKAWQNLLPSLAQLPDDTEILLVHSSHDAAHEAVDLPNLNLRWLTSPAGRAEQMNTGARAATGAHLWFLHADTQLAHDSLSALLQAMQRHPADLLYFDLIFLNDASRLMRLNAWGVWFRSHVLHVPFGDQGFCIARQLFHTLGGYPEGLPYGEDHVFVWRARQHGMAITPVNSTLYTSARKYQQHGWLKTTVMHQYLWLKQAWPEWRLLCKQLKKGDSV